MDPVFHVTLRVLLALLFGLAAAHKLRDPGAFRTTFAAYRLAPAWCAPAVIGAELLVVVALGMPGAFGPLAAALVLLAYAAAIGINLARGRPDIDCGCSGPAARRPIGWPLVARNVGLAVLASAGLAAVTPRTLVWVDAFTVIAATLAAAALYAAADRMLALAPLARRAAA
jgi:hypothetical protein